MSLKIYLDGKLVDKADATVSVFDHGLLYGDGVFEGIRSYNGLVFKLKEHLDRLYESAHTLMLQIPLSKSEMEKAVVDTLKNCDPHANARTKDQKNGHGTDPPD